MAMCLVRSFRQFGRFDGPDVADRFVQWMQGDPRDIGGTTQTTLSGIAIDDTIRSCSIADYFNVAGRGRRLGRHHAQSLLLVPGPNTPW